MKQCPSCRTTYTDDTLRYCLADGSVLDAVDDEQSTMVRSSGIRPAEPTLVMGKDSTVRVDIPTAGASTTQIPVAPARSSGSMIMKIVLVVVGLIILAVLLAGVAGGVFYYISGSGGQPPANNGNARQQQWASPTPAPTTKDDRDELRDQIANLEKRLDEQRRAGQNTNVPQKLPNRSTTTVTARVDSPGDGFLALRSLPNSEIGERVLKIPHGATIAVGACGPVVTPVKRTGRWCQASYNGYDGWVFDAYLIY